MAHLLMNRPMQWSAFIFGFLFSFFSAGNLVAALFFHIPYAKKVSRTHSLSTAQRIDGKLDIWHGPVPYGTILVLPILLAVSLSIIALVIFVYFEDLFMSFLGGIVSAILLAFLGVKDTSGSLKRTFNLSIGSNYLSNACPKNEFWTLKEEQINADKKGS